MGQVKETHKRARAPKTSGVGRFHYKQQSADFWIVAPAVLLAVVLGLWVAGTAVLENVRFVQFSSDVLQMVSLARDMARDFKDDDDHATRVLFERLNAANAFDVVAPDDPQRRGFLTPWGRAGAVRLLLARHEVRFDVPVTAAVCRRFLRLHAPDQEAIGFSRVAVRENSGMGEYLLIYDYARSKTPFTASLVLRACGEKGDVILSVGFYLKD